MVGKKLGTRLSVQEGQSQKMDEAAAWAKTRGAHGTWCKCGRMQVGYLLVRKMCGNSTWSRLGNFRYLFSKGSSAHTGSLEMHEKFTGDSQMEKNPMEKRLQKLPWRT